MKKNPSKIGRLMTICSLIALSVLVGITVVILLDIFFHEAGHFCFAYAFNKSAIAEFHYRPVDLLTVGEHQYVRYHGNVSDIFSLHQALLVYFGGLIFELIFFGLFLFISNKLPKDYKKGRSKMMLFGHGLLTGIIGGFVIMPFNGIEDWWKALNMLSISASLIIVVVCIISVALVLIWMYCFIFVSCKNFGKYLNNVLEVDQETGML